MAIERGFISLLMDDLGIMGVVLLPDWPIAGAGCGTGGGQCREEFFKGCASPAQARWGWIAI